MQKTDIQLPTDDPIDLWDFTRLIAKSICPSLREADDYAWLQKKLVKLPTSDLEIQSDMTTAEREAVLRILPGLPPHTGMSAKDREAFMDAYLQHPDRLPWKPVFVSEETVVANSLHILQIQEKHLLALQQEIASASIVAFDHHHISTSLAGRNTFIRREDALSYLKARRFRTTEDPGPLSASSAPKPRVSAARPIAPTKASSSEHQRESADADFISSPKSASTAAAPSIPVESIPTVSVSALSPATKPPAPHKGSKARRALEKSAETSLELEKQDTATVILRRRQVEVRTALSRSAIYDRLDPNSPRYDSTFPKQLKLGGHGVGWIESEIEAWLSMRMHARHSQ